MRKRLWSMKGETIEVQHNEVVRELSKFGKTWHDLATPHWHGPPEPKKLGLLGLHIWAKQVEALSMHSACPRADTDNSW